MRAQTIFWESISAPFHTQSVCERGRAITRCRPAGSASFSTNSWRCRLGVAGLGPQAGEAQPGRAELGEHQQKCAGRSPAGGLWPDRPASGPGRRGAGRRSRRGRKRRSAARRGAGNSRSAGLGPGSQQQRVSRQRRGGAAPKPEQEGQAAGDAEVEEKAAQEARGTAAKRLAGPRRRRIRRPGGGQGGSGDGSRSCWPCELAEARPGRRSRARRCRRSRSRPGGKAGRRR